jgi:DNA topoisomerase-2
MIFNKKRADERKDWLSKYDRNLYVDTNQTTVNYEEFINKELIHFSKYDCERSIPNLMDGLKISHRKILYSAFKKNLKNEIKVAQFSGYVSEHSGYHHGEASLNAAIVGMAQNFVGSNNINLFVPNGQFGTRLQGGKDAASERYIFTQLNKITRQIFRPEDDAILSYLDDDGLSVEPIFYVPIIPMVLINGSKGIGTGFSTDILSYNIAGIINYLKYKLNQDKNEKEISFEFDPFYNGFKGKILKLENGKYITKGLYTKTKQNKIRVTELPIGYWTDDFKQHLENLMDKTKSKEVLLKDYNDMSTDTIVDFELTFSQDVDNIIKKESGYIDGLEKILKLYSNLSTTNMHMFNDKEKLVKYSSIVSIIDSYYSVRLEYYQKRKQYMINKLHQELILLTNKANYIKENLNGTIDLRNKKKIDIIELLKSKNYVIIDDDNDYKYLLKMTMDSVSKENVEKILKDHDSKKTELEYVEKTSIERMWLNELEELEKLL